MLHAVVEVDRCLLGGDFEEGFLVVLELFELLLNGRDIFDGLRLFGLGFLRAVGNHLAMLGVVSKFIAEVAEVLPYGTDRFGSVTVHVDLLGSCVVGIKGVFQKCEILVVVLGAKSDLQELLEPLADVVAEPIALEDG